LLLSSTVLHGLIGYPKTTYVYLMKPGGPLSGPSVEQLTKLAYAEKMVTDADKKNIANKQGSKQLKLSGRTTLLLTSPKSSRLLGSSPTMGSTHQILAHSSLQPTLNYVLLLG